MRLVKFGTILVTVLCLLVGNASAATLQDALKAGKFDGKFTFMGVKGSDGDTFSLNGIRNRDSRAVTAQLNYFSGDFYGLKLGMSFQASHDLRNQDAATEANPNGEMDTRAAISATIMHQAYLQYNFAKTEVKVGRQIIHTPLLNSSEWPFPMVDSWDAVVLTTMAVPKTVIKAMFVKEWNQRDSEDSSVHFSDPLYSVFVKNSSVKGLTLIGQFLSTSEDFGAGNNGDMPVITYEGWDSYLLEANYKLPIQHPLVLGFKYGGAKFDQANQDDTNFFGLQVRTELAKIALEAAYTSVDDDNTHPGSYGHVPNSVFYNNMLMVDSLFAGTDTWSLKAGYNFGIKGLNASLMYTQFSQSDEGIANLDPMEKNVDGISEIDLNIKYSFSGALSGLSAQAIAGMVMDAPAQGPGITDEEDAEYVRFLVEYRY